MSRVALRIVPRRGFTLLEIIVVITVLGVMMTGVILLLELVLGANFEVHKRSRAVAAIGRLAEQFRSDVHRSRGEPQVAGNLAMAEFHLPGGRVARWQWDAEGGLLRAEHATGNAAENAAGHADRDSRDREDSFVLPSGTQVEFGTEAIGSGHLAALHIRSATAAGPSLAIEALASQNGSRNEKENGKEQDP